MTDITFVDHSTVRLEKHNASDDDVARAAWVSNYGEEARLKDTGKVKGLINYLYTNRHMSPFEHGSFTFFVKTPIFVAREFMRHRTWSYNEVSGRYKELSPTFYVPRNDRPLVQEGKVGNYTFVPGTYSQYAVTRANTEHAYTNAWNAYQEMLSNGVAREVARNVLPVGIMTEFYATANPRNVMQFLSLRNDKHALKEIRDVAIDIEKAFAEAMPLTYEAYRRVREQEENPVQYLSVPKAPVEKSDFPSIEEIEADLPKPDPVRRGGLITDTSQILINTNGPEGFVLNKARVPAGNTYNITINAGADKGQEVAREVIKSLNSELNRRKNVPAND